MGKQNMANLVTVVLMQFGLVIGVSHADFPEPKEIKGHVLFSIDKCQDISTSSGYPECNDGDVLTRSEDFSFTLPMNGVKGISEEPQKWFTILGDENQVFLATITFKRSENSNAYPPYVIIATIKNLSNAAYKSRSFLVKPASVYYQAYSWLLWGDATKTSSATYYIPNMRVAAAFDY